jgi:hypothetical protein
MAKDNCSIRGAKLLFKLPHSKSPWNAWAKKRKIKQVYAVPDLGPSESVLPIFLDSGPEIGFLKENVVYLYPCCVVDVDSLSIREQQKLEQLDYRVSLSETKQLTKRSDMRFGGVYSSGRGSGVMLFMSDQPQCSFMSEAVVGRLCSMYATNTKIVAPPEAFDFPGWSVGYRVCKERC